MEPLVDFYAGAIAMFAVVLFAKFATHRVRHNGKSGKSPWCSGWYWAHWVCVFTAWVGLLASLAILGHPSIIKGWYDGADRWWFGRWLVFVTALISATLLAFDVAVTGRDIGQDLGKIREDLRKVLPARKKTLETTRDQR
jgi:hypothetical protein